MEDMRRIAFETVARACGFGSLAIFCFMVGLSFDPVVAFQSGGTMMLLMTLIMLFKAREARTRDYRRTEMWLYLSEEARPPRDYAQSVTTAVMQDTYLQFAHWTAGVTVFIWVLALLFSLAGL